MTAQTGGWKRTVLGLLAGFLLIVILSTGTDMVMHATGIFPPQGQPMGSAGLYLLALAYRCVYGVAGSYVAARIAQHAPMRHALILGGIGLVLSTIGAVVMWDIGDQWYPVALAISTLPCAWIGGRLALARR